MTSLRQSLQLSCRRYLEDYPDWTEYLKVDGGKWRFVASLDKVESNGHGKGEEPNGEE